MRRPITFVVLPACLAIGILSSFRVLEWSTEAIPSPAPSTAVTSAAVGTTALEEAAPEVKSREVDGQEHADHPAADEPERHRRAPLRVNLFVKESTWLRAPGAEWFEAQAELEPGRYSYDETLLDGEGGWVDATDTYQLRYDEEEDVYAYWQWVSAAQLTRGLQDYVQFCVSCHGYEGDGYGRSAQHLRPGPRSFLQPNFKFTKVLKALPTDAALLRLIRRGLDGTPMLPWALSDEQLTDIIQYIKSLSPVGIGWRDPFTEIGDAVDAGEDPWEGRESQAIERGEKIYHGIASCHLCHPGYATPARLAELRGDPAGTKYRDDLTYPALKESDYTVLGQKIKILPPDFTWHRVRAGTTPRDLFETIASGIKGTAMPQWKGALPDEDLWATAHYVRSLIDGYLNQPAKRMAFMNALRRDQ